MSCTKSDCAGCRDDFYNHRTNFGGGNECWSLKSSVMVKARDVHRDSPPPYLRLPLIARPNCYHAEGYVRVKAESLTDKGFWK